MSTQTTHGVMPTFDMADRLRKALRVSGIGVQEMADHLGVSRNTVGAYISGRMEPSRKTVERWSELTGVDHWWLETGHDQTPPPDGPGEGLGKVLPWYDSNVQPAGYRPVLPWATAA